MRAIESTRGATRWITRLVPFLLAAAVGFATYVVVAHVCSDYLIHTHRKNGAAIAILVIYFVLLLLMVATYARTVLLANYDPSVVPLGPKAIKRRKIEEKNRNKKHKQGDIVGQPYDVGPDDNPDSPGLEQFYTKDVFVCESDGRPKWCSECCNWKMDRVHHSSEIGRCVYRMDHYCPWVGGMVGESSFKFFVQFTAYTACYCGVVLGATASTLRKKLDAGQPLDSYLLAAIVLGAFFGLFTSTMTLTSVRYIWKNMTNVDMLGAQTKVYQLAIRVPRHAERSGDFARVTYPLPRPSQPINGSHASQRDDLATRTFAIVRTEPGENPWDLGPWRNWQSVMGTSPLDWFLPIRRSPCANHENHEGFYPFGRVLADIRKRSGLPQAPTDENGGLELQELRDNTT
ncbi:palmitoyltransferase PFA5 [Xylariaceae sp. FL0016]|nr:palmitoyltransferase PFA5 [Xylariaceae sp. FL0016]